MKKRNLTKNKKVLKPKVANIYGEGTTSLEVAKSAFSNKNLGNTLGQIGGAIGDITTASLANAEEDTSKADNAIEAINNYQPNRSSLDALSDSYNNASFSNTDFNHKDFMVSTGEGLANMGKAALSGASAGASVGGVWGAVIGGAAGLLGSGAGWIAGSEKAKNAAEVKEREALAANASAQTKVMSAKDTIMADSTNEFLKNVAAYGGPIFNHSGDYNNDITFINEGGTHAQNPNQGVQIGVDNNNIPNLVEEGEIVFKDYVFSNRLKPTKELLNTNGFSDKYNDWTFAKIAEELQKESSERPNDIISNNGLNDMMNRLITLQESVREKKAKKDNKYSLGGKVNILEDGDDDKDIHDEITEEEAIALYGLDREEPLSLGEILDKTKPNMSSKIKMLSTEDLSLPTQAQILSSPTQSKTPKSVDKNRHFDWQSLGRIAPTITHASMAIANAAKKPDYSNAESIIEAANRLPITKAPHIGGKQVYTPINKDYMLTKHMNASRATARDIQNNAITGTQALGHLANLQHNTQSGISDAIIAMDRENQVRRMQVADFNRGIDQINAGLDMQAAGMNQQRGLSILDAEARAALLREQIDANRTAALSANLSGIAEDLGSMGKEALDRRSREDLIRSGALRSASKKNGGMLTKRCKRR